MTGKKNGRQTSKKPYRAIDLFSGWGGLSLGVMEGGFEVIGAVEIDSVAAETFRVNHPEVLVKNCDIRNLPATAFRRQLGLRHGQLDLLAGCPPCQGFSTLRTCNGANKNRDARNSLVREMLRFIREFRPKSVMMENVPGLIHHKPFGNFCTGLRKLGYEVTVDIKDAATYGVPQRRKRLILLAGRGLKIGSPKVGGRTRTVRDAIARLPKPGAGGDPLHNIPETGRSKKVQALIRDIPKNGGSRSDLPRNRQLACHKKVDGFKDVYGRMAWNDVSPTITSGCFNPSKGRFLHPVQNRAITMREAALLQSFPKNYFFDVAVGKQKIALMIGNALPPEFIRRHASMIDRALQRRR